MHASLNISRSACIRLSFRRFAFLMICSPFRRPLWWLSLPFCCLLLCSQSAWAASGAQNLSQPLPAMVSSKKSIQSSAAKIVVPIILYHYIEMVKDPKDILRKRLAISPSVFRRQLDTLQRNGYKSAFVSELPGILSSHDISKHVMLTFDDGYEDFYTDAYPLLKEMNMKATLYVVNDFLGKSDYLTHEQLLELSASGLIEIGAHTLDHKSLPGTRPAEMMRQIADSKRGLEQEIGKPVTTFAYPFGHYNAKAIQAVKNAGFKTAVTVDPGVQHSKQSLFVLQRIRAGSFLGPNMLKALKPIPSKKVPARR